MTPRRSLAIFSLSTSTQKTWWPRSAKQAPVTRPTWPVPMTEIFMELPGDPQERGEEGHVVPPFVATRVLLEYHVEPEIVEVPAHRRPAIDEVVRLEVELGFR